MKVLIFGRSGSGKTTLSLKLSELTGVPIFHIDEHFFEPGTNWKERSPELFYSELSKELKKKSWIIEGNGMRSLEMRFKEADLALFFNPPLLLCYLRIFSRALRSLVGGDPIGSPKGMKSPITWRLLKYVWNYSKRYKSKIEALKRGYPGVELVEVTSSKDLFYVMSRVKSLCVES